MAVLNQNYSTGDKFISGTTNGTTGASPIGQRINQAVKSVYGTGTDGAFVLATGTSNHTRGRVYQYSSFALNSTATITATNGSPGAPVIILVQGNATIQSNASISMRGAGCRAGVGVIGGGGGSEGSNQLGESSWSMIPDFPFLPMVGFQPKNDTNGTVTVGAVPNHFKPNPMPFYFAYGGGGGGGQDAGSGRGSGGGGGGTSTSGASGNGSGSGDAGAAGTTNGISSITHMRVFPTLCGAGGGGGGGTTGATVGNGGEGGGCIILCVGGDLNLQGTVDIRGAVGQNGIASDGGPGGGGGGGGMAVFLYEGNLTNTATMLSSGGTGGTGILTGGAGGNGITFVLNNSLGYHM